MKLFRTYRRASAGLEAALALPALLVIFGAVAQVMITAQSRVHLEQAAYAAARAGLAHKCPPFNIIAALRSPGASVWASECQYRRASIDAVAQQKAEDAARWALIAAAPTTGHASGRGCDNVPAAEDIFTRSSDVAGRHAAALNALCYVHEPGNVTVTIEWQQTLLSQISGRTDVPLRATVEFRYPLSTPFRRFVRDGKRGDGTYWKTGSATVTLL